MLVGTKKTVWVAMSGGVDSSVSALLLKQLGFHVVGVTFHLWDAQKGGGRSCCTAWDVSDAQAVARKIKIPHYTIDLREEFRKYVFQNFIDEYKRGRTPIPCVHCNDVIKFKFFLEKACQLGADFIATGHYARKHITFETTMLKIAKDEKKDQTYFLFTLDEKTLRKTIFPLGNLTKAEVRKIAKTWELPVAEKQESQDICFVEGRSWQEVLKPYFGERKGVFVDEKGNVVGYHNGYFYFTVGQRRGLGVALGKKVYVKKIIPEENKVVLAEKEKLKVDEFEVEDVSFPSEKIAKLFAEGFECVARVRYSHEGTPAIVKITEKKNGKFKVNVKFKTPYGPVVPGQACVFYKDNLVLGGGFISQVFYN